MIKSNRPAGARLHAILTMTIFSECREQGKFHRLAMADIIMNRLAHKDYPDTIIGVCAELKGFDFNGLYVDEFEEFDESRNLAANIIDVTNGNAQAFPLVFGAVRYHKISYEPEWAAGKDWLHEIDGVRYYD